MKLRLFRSLWTTHFDLERALKDILSGFFEGIEGPVPENLSEGKNFLQRLAEAQVPFIAEIVVGGGYVPIERSPLRQLEEFKRKIEALAPVNPVHATVLGGCDFWTLGQSVDWFEQAVQITRGLNFSVSFETHRSRPTFNPWVTRLLLEAVPELRLTCDFSHWCCVCERLIMNEEAELLALCAQRADHIHARVGYEQGPQVPHPRASEYGEALSSHQGWWKTIWREQEKSGRAFSTMTPEFGPDGYLQAKPFSREPSADLDEINRWMAQAQRREFETRTTDDCIVFNR